MLKWYELVATVRTIVLIEEDDSLVWKYTSSGLYSGKYFYGIVNNRGVVPVHTPALWRMCVPQNSCVALATSK